MSEIPKIPPAKKVDPGWNDPPMLNYSPSNPPPKSRIMNKRIPFPVGGASTATPSMVPASAPIPAKCDSPSLVQGPPKCS